MKAAAGFGSEDGIKVWLNNKKILKRDVPGSLKDNRDSVELNLLKGKNYLLMKIYNRKGGCDFYFSLKNDPLAALWSKIEKEFPLECGWIKRDIPLNKHFTLFKNKNAILRPIKRLKKRLNIQEKEFKSKSDDNFSLYIKLCRIQENLKTFINIPKKAFSLAVNDLMKTFPNTFLHGKKYLKKIDEIEKRRDSLIKGGKGSEESINKIIAFKKKVLLSNPLINFDKLLFIKRKLDSPNLGLPQNWQGNCSLPRRGYDDRLMSLSLKKNKDDLKTIFKWKDQGFIGDLDLHWDAEKMLFSSIGKHKRWQIFQIKPDGTGLRQVTLGKSPDVDNYDACYLPDGRIIFGSTRCFQGIPCVGGRDAVANLFIMNKKGRAVRQLCFDQDHNWNPVVLNNGRVLYLRWEYSDTPHYFSRFLFHMNPDGTGQMEYYGSNSFWPNSLFFARPIPNHSSRFVGIVSGHHGAARMGELVLFDTAKGRKDADGTLYRIPEYNKKVEPIIRDKLVSKSWPKFLHPYPLSSKYFLVSCKPEPDSLWGIYLVDIFNNMLLLKEIPGYALLEPTPLVKRKMPPAIPDKVDLKKKDAVVYMSDIYKGEGLKGIPRGTVKKLRIYEFHYAYNKMGGHISVGIEGPWDVRRIMGTVQVYKDGSASFKVPANTPIAVQPLDKEGKAVQLMRSWFTAMPGETISCVGCHAKQNSSSPVRSTMASKKEPLKITPWYGPTRGFSFKREVQPVLDRSCVGCHDGTKAGPDLSRKMIKKMKKGKRNFTPSYVALHPYVRRPGPESDYNILKPMEFYADTSELVQMLKKGHHEVKLDKESWDRIITWIDLNLPDHGTWSEHKPIPQDFHQRRLEMRKQYANRPEDPEVIINEYNSSVDFVSPLPKKKNKKRIPVLKGWPFTEKQAKARQMNTKFSGRRLSVKMKIKLNNKNNINMVLVPSGKYVTGNGSIGVIKEPFYMSQYEITREEFSIFDPSHNNGYLNQRHKDHTTPGYPVNDPDFPVIRVSWEEAMAFCKWLSKKQGAQITLPLETQWEWACRAGTKSPFYYGDFDDDFSVYANLADESISLLAVKGVNPKPIKNPDAFQDFLPKEERFNDNEKIMTGVGKYKANAWGLFDLHGNVCEWTRSDYQSPFRDGLRRLSSGNGKKVIRGGSWRDRPKLADSSFRFGYKTFQKVYNVGFRVIMKPAHRKVDSSHSFKN